MNKVATSRPLSGKILFPFDTAESVDITEFQNHFFINSYTLENKAKVNPSQTYFSFQIHIHILVFYNFVYSFYTFDTIFNLS